MDEEVKARTKLRGKATRLSNDLKEYRSSDSVDQDDLAYKIHVLEKVKADLSEVQTTLDKEGLYDDSNHVEVMAEELFKASRLLSRLECSSGPTSRSRPARDFEDQQLDLRSSLVVKLPTFEGDIMKWAEFWELFKVYIHNNPRYAEIQKFVLLKSHLGTVPKQVIEGIPASDEGYQAAVDLLTSRFARDDVRKELLMKQLLDLPAVSRHDDLKGMHLLIDQLNARVRGLKALGVTHDSFSSILLPVLRNKLPEAWRLEWARSQPQPATFESFLQFLQREMFVREQAATGPAGTAASSTSDSPRPAGMATVSGLVAGRQLGQARVQGRHANCSAACSKPDWLCVACGMAKHGLAACHVYRNQDVATRWEIVKAAGVCFRCLGPHLSRDCHSSDCPMCGGPHHSSLHRTRTADPTRLPPRPERHLNQPLLPRDGVSLQPPPADRRGGANQRMYSASQSPDGQLSSRQGWSATAPHQSMSVQPVPVVPAEGKVASASAPCTAASVMATASTTLSSASAETMPPDAAHCAPCDQSSSSAPGPSDAREGGCFTQTALVEATGPRGSCMLRVLIDGGSDSSYIRTSAADLLGLQTVGSGIFACMGFQERGEEPRVYEKVSLALRSRHGGEERQFDLWKTDRLCSLPTPARPPAVRFEPHLLLADDFVGGPVDVLIGVDQMYKVLMWDQIPLTDGLRAVETVFGYVLHGRDDAPVTSPVKYALRCCRLQQDCDQLWSLEALGIVEEEDLKRPEEPVWNSKEKRYEMGLLWASDDRPVTNLSTAASRTRRMEQRLSPTQHQEYGNHLAELRRADVIETPPEEDVSGFYLPHRGIWRNGKLRVVFDGSARDATGRSLNDYLETGGNLLRRLPAVLLNFRRDAVAAQADIRAAFHQVSVSEKDRRYLQFLWAEQRLRFRRAPFGLTCSPFMLLQTISVHLDLYSAAEPSLCEKLRAGLYMDDVCISFPSRAEAEVNLRRAERMFKDAGMELHKLRFSGDEDADASVLGLLWNPSTDHLSVCVPTPSAVTTRRELLSLLCKPFDPLGVLSPWLVVGRSLFQRTWREPSPAGWDDALPAELLDELAAWVGDSSRAVWFPRALTTSTDDVTYHVFCDASKKAYCCAIYVVQGEVSRLLMAKSRLAPLTPALSVPRLELMAALIGCRLMEFVQQSLNLIDPQVLYWTDAMDVLFWLSSSKQLKRFVQNRVTSILKLSRVEQWRHVGGENNPADLGTRGMSLAALERSDLWWTGPSFLRQASDSEPPAAAPSTRDLVQPSLEAAREVKAEKTQVRQNLLIARDELTAPFDITSCSTLSQAVHRLAWIFVSPPTAA